MFHVTKRLGFTVSKMSTNIFLCAQHWMRSEGTREKKMGQTWLTVTSFRPEFLAKILKISCQHLKMGKMHLEIRIPCLPVSASGLGGWGARGSGGLDGAARAGRSGPAPRPRAPPAPGRCLSVARSPSVARSRVRLGASGMFSACCSGSLTP